MRISSKSCIKAVLLALALFAGALPVFAQADTAAEPAASTDVPKLDIQIPGVEFSKSLSKDGSSALPFVGEYIGGIYTFAISVAGLVAAAMMMLGGFQYLTAGGDSGRVQAGKKRIFDALIGLVLALGSYALLYTINPELVTFRALQLLAVDTNAVTEFNSSLGTTTVDTSAGIPAATGGSVGTAGAHKWLEGSCPFPLTQPKDSKAGRLEFYTGIQKPGVITASSRGDKVVQIADLARVCGAMLGSCGRTAGAIQALAGVYDNGRPWYSCCLQEDACKASCASISNAKTRAACLKNAGNCNDAAMGKSFYQITQTQRYFLYALRCDTEGSSKWPTCSFDGPWTSGSDNCIRRDCVKTQKEAVQRVQEFLGKQAPLPELVPGDRLVVYNGNTDLVGAHAITFMGWSAQNKNVMQTINGTAGRPTFAGGSCVKPPCGSWPLYPVLYAWRP